MLDLNQISKDCDINGDAKTALPKIADLDNKLEQEDLILVYNYILANSKVPEILSGVVKLADRFRDKTTLGFLTDILLNGERTEEFISVRSLCAKAISNFKDTSVVTSLLNCLNNKNEHYRVRLACADALGKIGDKYAVIPLIDVANDETEKSVYLRESAVSALGLIGDMRAIDPLVSILETKQGILSKFTFLKERALEALTKIKSYGNDRVFRALKSSLMDESPQVRINAIEAIMESEHPKSVETIRECLSDSDEEVRKNALIALYNLIGRDILDEVISLPVYDEFLKNEAEYMIREYEEDDNE